MTVQTKSTSKSTDKNKYKKEEIKTKEDQERNELKKRTVDKLYTKQSDKTKLSTRTTSSRQFQSSTSSSNSSNSNISLKSNQTKTSASILNKKQISNSTSKSRIQKTQFFPNTKQMYANVVKARHDSPKDMKNSKEHSKTLNPSEAKTFKSDSEYSSLETFVSRPQTATIRKGIVVKSDPDDYEDDFESYESDFEEDTSSSSEVSETSTEENEDQSGINTVEADEEHKLDSGNFDLPEVKHVHVLDNIKENDTEIQLIEPNRSNLTSLSDEGFEDVKRKRGEELAGMIKLDAQTFTIFEMESIVYHEFIRKFGNNNTVQTSIQTGQDCMSIEIQTIEMEHTNKWTQYPIKLSEIKKTNINLNIYKQENLGVGIGDIETNLEELKHNEHSLKYFMKSVSHVILNLIEENLNVKIAKKILKTSCLENVPVTYINFSNNTTKLITIHAKDKSSILCIWKISDPNAPEYFIKVHGIVTCAVLIELYIYGGLSDGSIAIWDLQQQDIHTIEKVTPPSYITNIDTGHTSKIVSIEVIEGDEKFVTDDTCNFQVYSLDEDGYFIVWTVIMLQTILKKHISLQQSLKCSFKQLYPHLSELQCTNMAVNQLDVNHIFVSTNYEQILHIVTTTGTKANPTKYSTGMNKKCVNHTF
ncbi:wd repeat domain 60 [Holotrichia oblita]|uniref:Wd repeat domain 60 n=1 Tax=Holotrichia oblita TaxID=644536 RepID=A0ACB9SVH6_HOLOL|nr:wd repeat domain 60 [Holotrichia oblita]